MSGANNAQGFPNPGGTGTVTGVTAADASIVIGGTAAAPTVRTGTLDVIATLHAPVAAVALNAQKITGLANGSAASDAAAFGQIPTSLPTTQSLDQIAVSHPTAADVAMNTHKITGLTNGSAATDAAAFGQVPLLTAKKKTSTTDYNALTQTAITAVDTTNLRLTITADGVGDVELFAMLPRVVPPVTGALRLSWLKDTSTNLTATGAGFALVAAGLAEAVITLIGRDPAPSAGSHTYDLAYRVGAGTGEIDGSDAGPIWICAVLVPPAS
jgi:hypothetical protein